MSQRSTLGACDNISAEPNPLPADRNTALLLSWNSSSKQCQLCVSENDGAEKVMSTHPASSLRIDWIEAGRTYVFRLYEISSSRHLLDEIKVWRQVTGKLTAFPNPIPIEAGSKTRLQWEITSPASAEICISEGGPSERVVCRGVSGSFEVSGLRAGVLYFFRLYGGIDRELLDEVEVRLVDIPWDSLLDRIKGGRVPGIEARIAEFIGQMVPRLLHREEFGDWYRSWEERGFHVTPVHFYEPIPDSRELSEELWRRRLDLPGVDMNDAMQRKLLCETFPAFKKEYQNIPIEPTEKGRFYLENGRFEGVDPLLAYCLMRHFKPRKIIEVGSGFSTLILAEAARVNGNTELHSIDPYPQEIVTQGVLGLTSLTKKKVQDVDFSLFTALNSGDCLFIDTSHVVKIGGDVNFLILEVLPRLKPGVVVHLHDIFFPFEYPKKWVIGERRFWTEQYLLQAFLAFNSDFQVLISSGFLNARLAEESKPVFPMAYPPRGGSFWMRRKESSPESGNSAAAERQVHAESA